MDSATPRTIRIGKSTIGLIGIDIAGEVFYPHLFLKIFSVPRAETSDHLSRERLVNLKIIDVESASSGRRLTIIMDGSRDETVGYLASGSWAKEGDKTGSLSAF